MCISELLPLRIQNISFVEGGMKVFIEKSKVDQLREGKNSFYLKNGITQLSRAMYEKVFKYR